MTSDNPTSKFDFDRDGPLKVVGHIWWNKDGRWRRFVVRRPVLSPKATIHETYLVVDPKEFCPACLSQNVRRAPPNKWECLTCHIRWWWLKE
jgi:hypothetical protein